MSNTALARFNFRCVTAHYIASRTACGFLSGALLFGATIPSRIAVSVAQDHQTATESTTDTPVTAAVATETSDTATKTKYTKCSLAGGKLQLEYADAWKRVEPKIRMLDAEFQIPAADGDEQPARLTIMSASGSIELNKKRWYSQFKQDDGQPTAKVAKEGEIKVGSQTVHLVDLTGTYTDPFDAKKQHQGYRMLAAIIPISDDRHYFVKLYGSHMTMAENERAFRHLVKSIQLEK